MAHQARKRFGQNFLHDERVIYAILSAINPRLDQHLVEIGPGQGALTQFLLPECERLDAIELDRDLVALLQKKFQSAPNLVIHSKDALKFDFRALGEKLRIVGNLPYNISTPILFHLFDQSACIKDMHFMLQKEVVDRLLATEGEKDYGRLSIMAQYHCQMEWVMDVYPESFHPEPKVMSSIICLMPHIKKPVEVSEVLLSKVVAEAFMQRRKTLRNSLSRMFNEEALLSLDLDPKSRAENLSLKDYAKLANLLASRL